MFKMSLKNQQPKDFYGILYQNYETSHPRRFGQITQYQIRREGSLIAEIQARPKGSDLELQIIRPPEVGSDSFVAFCDWLCKEFCAGISRFDKVMFAGAAMTLPSVVEQLAPEDNPALEAVRLWLVSKSETRALPELPPGVAGASDLPPKPEITAPHDLWFGWYHLVTDELGYSMSLKKLANEMGLSYGYVRQLHLDYLAQFRTET